MPLPEAYLELLAAATGLPVDQLPADPADRLAAVHARQLIESRAARGASQKAPAALTSRQLEHATEIVNNARRRFGGRVWMVRELTANTRADSDAQRRHIGRVLGRAARAQCVIEGFRIEEAGSAHGTVSWRLRAVGEQTHPKAT